MAKKKPFLLVSILFLVLFSGWAPVLGENNQVTVECVGEDGTPLRNVKVWAWAVPSGQPVEKKTNKQGIAVFKKLDDGIYRFWARIEDYEPAYHEFLRLNGNKEETIKLLFKAGDMQKALYFEDPALRERSNQLMSEGIQAAQNKNAVEAIEKYKASLAINPSNIDAHHNLGLAYVDQKDYELAVKELEEELVLLDLFKLQGVAPAVIDQRVGEVKNVIGLIPILILQGEAEDAFSAKNYDVAVEKLQKITELQPDNAGAYFNLAAAQFQAQNFDAAMASVDTALAKEPENKGMLDLKKAISQGKEGLVIQRSREKLTELSLLYKDGKFQEFVDRGSAVAGELVPQLQPALWYDMAKAHMQLEDVEGAVQAYRKLIELSPDKPDYLKELGQYLLDQGKVDEGVDVYKEYWGKQSEPVAPALFALGEEAARKGNDQLSLGLYRHSMEADPQYAEPYYALGMQHYFAEDYGKAKELLNRYLELGDDAGRIDNVKTVLFVIGKKTQ